jgi:putative redox protein
MPFLTVTHQGSHRFEVNVEGHRLIVDDRAAGGGRDAGPTPNELLAASLGSGAAANAETYLTTHGHSTAGLVVACRYELNTEQPPAVTAIEVTVTTRTELPIDQRRGLLKAVEQCIVGHNLRTPPLTHILLAAAETPSIR